MRNMTLCILRKAIAQQQQWLEQDMRIRIAVNLSMLDVTDATFAKQVKNMLQGYPQVAQWMTLEVTESGFMHFPNIALNTLRALANQGFRISIDDYGTGYSSLSYLQQLPVHELKIDQSFVRQMLADKKSEAIVQSTIDLGHNLGMEVVAEGIESPAIRHRLRALGCDLGQGYAVARPMPANELEVLYNRQANPPESGGTP